MDNQLLGIVWASAQLVAFGVIMGAARLTWLWRYHRAIGGIIFAWSTVSFPLIFISKFPMSSTCIAVAISLYSMVDLARLWMNRFPEAYLRRVVPRDIGLLTAMALVTAGSAVTVQSAHWHIVAHGLVAILLGISIIVGIYMLRRVYWAVRHYQAAAVQSVTKMSELPTVTLAIPARNETRSLDDALALAIKSDYPKLEILVLDDCSQDATAQVIRSYAHDGVRFIQGEVPATGWQGKNYACEVLAREASGEVLIFAGVDTHLGAQTISHLISYMLRTNSRMLSVLPTRRSFDFWPAFLEQLRNFWQVVLPITNRRLPISSPCWAIWSEDLHRIGGFAAFKNSVLPEVHFAEAMRQRKSYAFIFSNQNIDVTTRKRLHSQLETATRTFYPTLKRRPSYVLAVSLGLAVILLLPYGVVLWQLLHGEIDWLLWVLALAAISCMTVAHCAVLRRTSPKSWWIGPVNFPLLVLFDALLYNWSMLQFEFGEVNWKGRNVCYPLIEVVPMQKFIAEAEHITLHN